MEIRSNLTIGNAATDSRELQHWFVGDIENWMADRQADFDADRFGLRSNADVEIKWGVHSGGERRPGGWARQSDNIAVSILLQGHFVILFRDPEDYEVSEQTNLRTLGDYVIWHELLEHYWYAETDSLVLTVRWLPRV